MKKLLVIVCALFMLTDLKSQVTKIINYEYENLSGCNVFATATTIDGYSHLTTLSRPQFNNNEAISLITKSNGSSSVLSTIYSINHNFKLGYNYKISVYYKGAKGSTDAFFPNVGLSISTTNGGTDAGTTCVGPSAYSVANANNFIVGSSGSGFAWANNLIDYTMTQNADYLLVGAFPFPSTTESDTVFVKQIKIVETAPFSLSPSSLPLTCGSTAPQTFTVNNLFNLSGTISYTWNLGSSNNGWLYNGSPAPQTIQTTTNTLTLTPVCGNTSNNIFVSVTANSNNYTTNTSVISSSIPTFIIGGSDVVCSGSENYSITNLPCNATVSWLTSDPAIASVSSSSNIGTLTQVGNGLVTLTANVSACGQPQTVTKQVPIGLPPAPTSFLFNTVSVTPQSAPSFCLDANVDYEVFIMDVVPATTYTWTVNGNGQLRFGQGTSEVGITTGYNSYNWLDVTIQPENGCGTGSSTVLSFPVCSERRMPIIKAVKLSPNPASEMVMVQIDEAKLKTNASLKAKGSSAKISSTTEISILDFAGIVRRQIKAPTGAKQYKVNLVGLKPGIYFIEVSIGQAKERQQLIIQK